MTDIEIRAKALEIAALILPKLQSSPYLSQDRKMSAEINLRRWNDTMELAVFIEKHLRDAAKKTQ